MKNIIHLPPVRILIRLTVISLVFSCVYNCNSKDSKTHNFFYSGKDTIEITISGDTIGVLVNNPILDSSGGVDKNSELIKKKVDSILTKLGYIPSGYLGDNETIRLYISPNHNQSPSQREKEAQSLKNNNKLLITNAGYLARLKGSNNPIIITDEIIIRFKNGTKDTLIKKLMEKYGLNEVRKSPFDSLQYTVSVTNNSSYDALVTSYYLKDETIIDLSQLNYIYAKKLHSVIPNDDFFDQQWSLLNTGGNGTDDADIDADLAWDFSTGLHNTTIAVIDYGFDVNHYDLLSNFSHNTAELPWNNIDDDGNGFVDDTIGWNFDNLNNNLSGASHGTAVSGLIGAVGNNDTGISGSCPKCGLLPIKNGSTVEANQFAFQYAKKRGAKIINCSWEINASDPAIVIAAISDAANAGITIVCSMSNTEVDYCTSQPGLPLIPGLILVSRSTSKDEFDHAGWGDCMSCLTPTGPWGLPGSNVSILTTDVLGPDGFNNGTRDILLCPPFANSDFTSCFSGTSTSAALTSGVAGLILSANPSLSPQQVKYLIQDCADKIENSKAMYSAANGKSDDKRHGYGRLNAYEAVKIASPEVDNGGRNGVDIFLRDNELDWGNTEKPSSYLFEPIRKDQGWWKSMDIKVDAKADETPATVNNVFFEGFTDQSPVAEKPNNVFVRVRNRGFHTSREVTVKLYWVHAGATLPPLASDFWDRFPLDAKEASEWTLVDTKTIPGVRYSGASNADPIDNTPQIVSFVFNAPFHDPSTRNHYCLMAIISSPDDLMPPKELKSLLPESLPDDQRLSMDYVTTHYNNVTHRNYNIITEDAAFTTEFNMYNPLPGPLSSKLEVSFKGQKIPVHFSDSLEGKLVYLKKKEKKLVRLNIDPGGLKEPTEITIQQVTPGKKKGEFKIMGGISFLIMPSSKKSAALKSKK